MNTPSLHDHPSHTPYVGEFEELQLATLREFGEYQCSVCEEAISYQSRHWGFCAACGEISHQRCLDERELCFRCRGA